jgi:thiamine pyrophosphate-dependent acetolactate synthase large subunit-like protein
MTRMTGGQAVVQTLKANGVTTVFGIPGTHNLPIYDALYNERAAIRHILARHEAGAGLMANGYARASGRPGIAVVTTGPAAGNIMGSLGDAYRDSVPVLVIASQITSGFIGQDRGMFHEMRDQLGMAAAVSKWSRRVTRVSDIPTAVNEAWLAMTTGRPRPAYIEIPEDILAAAGEVQITSAPQPALPAAPPQLVAQVAQRLHRAARPLIFAGGGVHWSGAGAALARLAGTLGAPVATTCNGKGALPHEHPLALGFAAYASSPIDYLWQRADTVLAVGTDLDEITTNGWQLPPPGKLFQVDIDATQIGRNYAVEVGLVGDADTVLRQILEALDQIDPVVQTSWANEALDLRRRLEAAAVGTDGLALVQALSAALGRDGITTGDAACVGSWQLLHQPVYEPRTFLFPLGFGTLGFGLPAALGAQAAYPQRRVICLCGDGGFLFTGQELACAVQHGLNVVTVVVNDHTFGAIRRQQERHYGGRVFAAELVNPDFPRLAEAYGAMGLRISAMDELMGALNTAFSSGKPALIEVPGPLADPCVDLRQ